MFERQQNALLGAAQRDDVVAIKNILQSGAAVSYANSVGQTALHIATLWGNASAWRLLCRPGPPWTRSTTSVRRHRTRVGKQSNTANRILCAKTLIKAGCDLGKKNEDGVMAYQYLNGEEGDDVVELRKHHRPSAIPLVFHPLQDHVPLRHRGGGVGWMARNAVWTMEPRAPDALAWRLPSRSSASRFAPLMGPPGAVVRGFSTKKKSAFETWQSAAAHPLERRDFLFGKRVVYLWPRAGAGFEILSQLALEDSGNVVELAADVDVAIRASS